MAANRVILTAGEALKREAKLMSGTITPGRFVMPASNTERTEEGWDDKSTGAVVPATAGYRDQFSVVDLSSINGMAWINDYKKDSPFSYNETDQIPILYPTNGCIVNVQVDEDQTADIAMGAYVAIGANSGIVEGNDTNYIGVANENYDVDSVVKRVKVEVLK